MANTYNNINDAAAVLAKIAATMLKDELQFCKHISVAPESEWDGKNGYKSGQTIQISKPARFVPQNTFDITSSQQDVVEERVALTLDVISTIGTNITTQEIAHDMAIKEVAKRVVAPAMSSIAQDVERQFLEKASDGTYNVVGTAGATTFSTEDVLSARTKMNKFLSPKDNNRYLLLDSEAGAAAVADRKGLFQSSTEIAKQYEMGMVGRADGFNWLENELLNVHTNGTDVTGGLINGTIAEGASSLTIDGLTGGATITKGSVFTIAGVNAVHPITKEVYAGTPLQFVVTADAVADGGGAATILVSPAIYAASGGLQNVDALPADNAALTFVGAADTAYVQNLAFHKDAYRMASVGLELPSNAEFAAQATVDGITVAIVRDFDVNTRNFVTRLDFLGGLSVVRPEFACRITS